MHTCRIVPLRQHLSSKSLSWLPTLPQGRGPHSRGPLRPLDILLARILVFFYFFTCLYYLPPSPSVLNSHRSSYRCIYPPGLAQDCCKVLNERMNTWATEWMTGLNEWMKGSMCCPLVHNQDMQTEPQALVLTQRISLGWENRTCHPGTAAVCTEHCSSALMPRPEPKYKHGLTGERPELDPLTLGFHRHWFVLAFAWRCSPENRWKKWGHKTLKTEPGNRYRVVRTEASLPLPTGMGQMKQGIFSELRWRGGRTRTSQGHSRPLGGSVQRGLGQGSGNKGQGSSPRDHRQALLSFNFCNYNVEKIIAPSSQGDGED